MSEDQPRKRGSEQGARIHPAIDVEETEGHGIRVHPAKPEMPLQSEDGFKIHPAAPRMPDEPATDEA